MNSTTRTTVVLVSAALTAFTVAACSSDSVNSHSDAAAAASTTSMHPPLTNVSTSAATEETTTQAAEAPDTSMPVADATPATNSAGVVTDPPHTGTSSDGTLLCGSYTVQADNTTWTLVVNAGGVSCATARSVLDDFNAGRGTPTARNAASIDGYVCAGNPAGEEDETGVSEYCNDPFTAQAIQSYTIHDWRQAVHPTHFELEMS